MAIKQEAASLTTELPARIIACRVANIWPLIADVLLRRTFQESATVNEGKLLATTYKVLGGNCLERTAAAPL